jgi:PhnB protein
MTNSISAVQPYVFFGGRCEEALNFYRETIGAEIIAMMRFSDSPEPHPHMQPGNENKVMHASFRIGETTLMASDGMCEGNPNFNGFSLAITVPDDSEAERVFNALAQGGKITTPLTETFWTSKFGMFEDRFGLGWMVSVEHKA